MKFIALALAVSTSAMAVPNTLPTKVEHVGNHTEYQFPVGSNVTAPLVIVVPDTTVPLQQIIITNTTPPQPKPVVITGSLSGATLPGGVRDAQEAMKFWPFANLLEKADTVFIVPETIKLDKSMEASLVIDLSKDAAKFLVNPTGSNVKGEKIEISRVVVTKILAPDFDVIEVTKDGRQLLNLTGPTEWRWTLTPNKIGEYKVNVTVSAVIEIGNDRAERLIKVFNHEVTVFVTPTDAAKYFFSKNWQWLWSTLVLPFGIWIWRDRSKKKKALLADDAE
jgi:hypothetical protein